MSFWNLPNNYNQTQLLTARKLSIELLGRFQLKSWMVGCRGCTLVWKSLLLKLKTRHSTSNSSTGPGQDYPGARRVLQVFWPIFCAANNLPITPEDFWSRCTDILINPFLWSQFSAVGSRQVNRWHHHEYFAVTRQHHQHKTPIQIALPFLFIITFFLTFPSQKWPRTENLALGKITLGRCGVI